MNRFLWALLLFSYCALHTQNIQSGTLPAVQKLILPQDFFINDKDALYKIRIEIADFIKNLQNSALKVPSLLNEISSLAQELINTMVKIEQNNTETVMPSLLNINEKISAYQKATNISHISASIKNRIHNNIKRIQALNQKFLDVLAGQQTFSKKDF